MRLFGHYVLASRVRLFVAEQAAIGVLFLAAVASGGLQGFQALLLAIAAALAMQAALYFADLYEPTHVIAEGRWMMAAGVGVLLATLVWARAGSNTPGMWLAACALAVTVLLMLRGLSLSRPRRAVVLGTGRLARAVGGLREATSDCHVIGYVPDANLPGSASLEASPSELPLLLDRGDIGRVAQRMKADLLIIATELALPEESLARARAEGVDVVSAAGF
ncbi:MAG: nucleoside-diphosphate sugar epimerase/dehydratase, partial [Gemmatimonadales bacterium]